MNFWQGTGRERLQIWKTATTFSRLTSARPFNTEASIGIFGREILNPKIQMKKCRDATSLISVIIGPPAFWIDAERVAKEDGMGSEDKQVMKWLDALPKNRRRGSFPRCLLLMSEDRTIIANRLTTLVGLPDVRVEASDLWMPQGLPALKATGEWDTNSIQEAKLGESRGFLSNAQRNDVTSWWLAVRERANTPNWDIASTCTIGEKPGLLLVEAKAHNKELKIDGKPLEKDSSDSSRANHERIGHAIFAASVGLDEAISGWKLSRDSHYQLANRFAWAWNLASMDISVVLVYLGFLGAKEMKSFGEPFVDSDDWSRIVIEHSRNIVPEQAWNRDIKVGYASIKPLIRVWKQELPGNAL
jgi:hypothetical protein